MLLLLLSSGPTVVLGGVPSGEVVPGPHVAVPVEELSFVLGGVPSGEVVPGPLVGIDTEPPDPVVPASPLSVTLPGTGTELLRLRDRTWTDPANDVGEGGFTIQADDDQLATLVPDLHVHFRDRGQVCYSVLLDSYATAVREQGEEAEQVVQCSGGGLLTEWSRALVYPDVGSEEPERLAQPAPENRIFNFAGSTYVGAGDWPLAVATNPLYGQPGQRFPMPDGWPARTAQWLWDRSSTSPVPVGRAYFRTVFATPSGYSRFKLYVAGADDVTLWLDGVPVITAEGLRTGKSETVELEIGPGFHIFAAEARNRGGRAGFLFTAQPIHTDGTLAAPWLSSDASYWRCIAYTTPARFTAGKILRVLLNEANARGNEEAGTSGTLLGWNLRFDDLVDSDGNPWPLIKNYSVSVGTDLLSVLHQLADEHIDFACSPSRRDLYAWRKGTRGGNVPVTFAPEVNITSLSSVAES